MDNLFYRPTGFEEIKEDKTKKFKQLFKRPVVFDQMEENKSKYRFNETIYDNPDEFLKYLCDKNGVYSNYKRDVKSIQRYLEYKSSSNKANFMYDETNMHDNVDAAKIQLSVDETHSSDAFNISNSINNKPDSESKINYRITLRNSPYLKTDELTEFIKTFKREANKRNLFINCKILFESSDGIVFYVDKNNLPGTVKLLEELKDENIYGEQVVNAINNFGYVQPFSATLTDNSYYSIAMHGVEPSNSIIKSSRGGGLIDTFNGYIDSSLELIYAKLMNRYNQDSSKITPDEMYNCMIDYHQSRMKVEEQIPLWMNNRIYDEINEMTFSLK